MKKYVFLTSVLALAACGGGSGGGFNSGDTARVNNAPMFRSSDLFSNTEDNVNVTQMKTQVIVDSGGHVIAPNTARGATVRAGSILDTKGRTYKIYDLEDVKLNVADEVPGWLKIGLAEDGAIKDITMSVGGTESKLARDGTSNTFRGPIFEYVEDEYAKVGENVFSVANGVGADALLRDAIASGYHFAAGNWEQQGDGSWKYKRTSDSLYEQRNGNDFVIADNRDAHLAAVKDANNFNNNGKWVTEDGNIKYVEYGDQAEFRIVDGTEFSEELRNIDGFEDSLEDGHATMTTLGLIATHEGLSGGHWNLVDERLDVMTNKHIAEESGNANAPVLQYSDFGHFNPVYRSKHVDLDGTVLSAIRTHGADIEAALAAGNETDFNNLLAAHSELNRNGKDKYRTNEEMTQKLGQANYQLFAGGYAIDSHGNLIESGTFDAPTGATFTGTGVGRVYTSIHANNDGTETEYRKAVLDLYGVPHDGTEDGIRDAGHDEVASFITNSAQLTVDASGNQTLEMNFPNFYQVVATKAAGGATNVTLGNPNNVGIATMYKKNGDVDIPTYTTETHQVTSTGAPSNLETTFLPGYYGVGTVSEAAGLVRYADEANAIQVKEMSSDTTKTFTREFEFQGAYGMKKD